MRMMFRRWLFFSLLSLSLIFTDRVIGLKFLRAPVQSVAHPAEYYLREGGQQMLRVVQFASRFPFVYQENEQLRRKLVELYLTRVEVEQLRAENRALRKQLKVTDTQNERWVLARVLGADPRRGAAFLIIDKGAVDGVKVGQVAVVEKLLVGRVVTVDKHQSVVGTIYSREEKVPVKIRDNLAIVQGEFGLSLQVKELLQGAQVTEGEVVVTSGIGGNYPPGLLIGKIGQVRVQEEEPFKTATVEPFWKPAELSVVFIRQ